MMDDVLKIQFIEGALKLTGIIMPKFYGAPPWKKPDIYYDPALISIIRIQHLKNVNKISLKLILYYWKT